MPIEVLLVEDSPGDVRLTQEAFGDANGEIRLHVAVDGVDAMAFLKREGLHVKAPRPDLILLDLNLPKMDGREVLARIKRDSSLSLIPVVILTTSDSEADIVNGYQLQANCFLSKPVQLDKFETIVKSINYFWLTKVKLPQQVLVHAPDDPINGTGRVDVVKAIAGSSMKVEVLLVEDNPGDARLTQEAFYEANSSVHVHVACDGVEAMAFLRHEGAHLHAPRPALILLDLNMPKMDGREVLALIKADANLRQIPIVILSTSEAKSDIAHCYEHQANCYLSKPVQLPEFESLVKGINDFWLTKVKLPQKALSI
jgi:two-component system, chemotaxis family, response regulator Rcp1